MSKVHLIIFVSLTMLAGTLVARADEAKTSDAGKAVELSKGGAIEVVVTDEKDNSPIKKARVRIMGEKSGFVSGIADDKGVARFSLAPGNYNIQLVYSRPRYALGHVNKAVTVVAGKTERVEVQLMPTSRIFGVVRDPEGQPVEGVKLEVLPYRGRPTTSNASGEFDIALIDRGLGGNVDSAQMLLARHVKRDLVAAVEIEIDATEPVDIKLQPGIAITGKVIDPKGQPITNAAITAMLHSSSWATMIDGNRGINTDADGRFQVKSLPPDQKIQVSATAPDFGRSQVELELAEAVDFRIEVPPITLQVANMSIAGIVVDEDDKPLAGVRVSVHGQGQAYRQATTDAAGKFSIDKVCEGDVQISVNVQKPTPMWAQSSAEAGDKDVRIVVVEQSQVQTVDTPTPVKSLVGKPLPDMDGLNVDVAAQGLEGKVVLVAFFDVRQRPSRHYLKKLAGMADALRAKGLSIVVVQAAPIKADELQAIIKRLGVDLPMGVIQDNAVKTRAAWTVRGLPWLTLADTAHIVRADNFVLSELEAKLKTLAGK